MRQVSLRPSVIIIAGPNGAGKSTFAAEYLPGEANCPIFLNADEMALEIDPVDPESPATAMAAGRRMIKSVDAHIQMRDTFAFETTLSGRAWAQKIPLWRQIGYVVKLYFLMLPSVDMAVHRVARRVSQGGHNVPEHVIRRRYDAGLRNYHTLYKPLVDAWVLFDNGSDRFTVEQGVNPYADHS